MARLFLIRHGEPEAAWGGADHDPGLSERGRAQAIAAAEALAREGDLALLTSPLRRCRETAAPYAALVQRTPVVEPRAGEVVAPEGVGDRRAWLLENFPWTDPQSRRTWASRDAALRAWRESVLAFARGVERDAAVFSHFIAINVIVGAALGRDETIACRPGHASIVELAVEADALHLVRLGAEMSSDDVR